jgi:hypothetical protein
VKANFLTAQELPALSALNSAVRVWLETVANVRLHRETQRRPVDLWAEEPPAAAGQSPSLRCRSGPGGARRSAASGDLQANRHSVPARFAGAAMTLTGYPEHRCLKRDQHLIARPVRCLERHRDIADPDLAKALVGQRRHAQDAHALVRFLALCPQAPKYHEGLLERRGNAPSHVRKILALADIHGTDTVSRAMADAIDFAAQQPQVHRPPDPGPWAPPPNPTRWS